MRRQLSMEMIRRLTDACVSLDLDPDAILMGLDPSVTASIRRSGMPPNQAIASTWYALNRMSASGMEPNPLLEALKSCHHLRGVHPSAHIFLEALEQLAMDATVSDGAGKRTPLAFFTQNTKRAYSDLEYRVTPPADSAESPFFVTDSRGRTSICAVALVDETPVISDLDVVIQQVTKWTALARKGGHDAEGVVILAPKAQAWARSRVIEAGLTAMDYCPGVDWDHLSGLVDLHRGDVLTSGAARSFVLEGRVVTAAKAALAFFNNPAARVGLFVAPSGSDGELFAGDLFCAVASCFLRSTSPAPLLIGDRWRAHRLLDCALLDLQRSGVPTAALAINPLFREGMWCPFFVCAPASPSPPTVDLDLIPRILEGRSDRSKAVVAVSHADVQTAYRLERALSSVGCGVRLFRGVA